MSLLIKLKVDSKTTHNQDDVVDHYEKEAHQTLADLLQGNHIMRGYSKRSTQNIRDFF